MLMFVIIAVVFFWLRPTQVKRCWPLLLPGLVVIHIAVPGTIGGLVTSFFPKGGLVAQQTNAAVGSGRLATLGPALHREFRPNPLVGEGFATRIVDPLDGTPNAPILDDQWAGVAVRDGAPRHVRLALALHPLHPANGRRLEARPIPARLVALSASPHRQRAS